MQGYRGGNRQHVRITYLIGLWLTCLSTFTWAQRLPDQPSLTWYVPKSPVYRGIATSQLVEYTSLTELTEKLVKQGEKPYHLTLQVEKNTADWPLLQRLASPTSLAIELTDTLMGNELMPILAGWTKLERLDIRSLVMSRPGVKNGPSVLFRGKSGEVTFSFKPVMAQLSGVGWDKLTSVRQITLDNNINLPHALKALKALPALESLVIQQYAYEAKQDLSALAGLSKLTELTILGQARVAPEVFKGLINLTALTIHDPNLPELNEGLTYLKKLRRLEVHCFPASELRLGTLPALLDLSIQQFPNRSGLVPNDARAASLAKRSVRSLDSTLAGLTSLQRVQVEGLKLESFPASLLANRQLVFLSMPDVDLPALPANLDQLAALEELIIDNNPLHSLPAAVCRLSRLRVLSASKCELEALPDNIGQLSYLTNLSINSNLLASLPASMEQLKKLRQLNVSMNQLTALPDFLGTLPALETVAAFWNQISRFPTGMTQVRALYLTDNQIATLPKSLSRFRRLTTLLLDNNPLTSLSDGIGQLDSLETLVLGGNLLTALPDAIGSLRRLSRFTLGPNQIRVLPAAIGGLTSLTSVTIRHNPIEQLPVSIRNWQQLTTLDLTLLQLESLPDEIGQWQQLTSLSVESDRLLVLPTPLTDCQQLTYLSVTGSRLIGLPESLHKLTQLSTLALVGRSDSLTGHGLGRVMMLPARIASCKALVDLTMQHQQQFDGVESLQLMAGMPALHRIAFVNCGFTDLAGVSWKNLLMSTLNLSQNRFSQLSSALLEAPNLEQANFSETNLPAHLNRSFFRRTELAEALKLVIDR
ncbi:leucine-rich repeat domain-containing protein [Fibrivirga algicola]|uniref:Disease resistance R13L4/SHOC-2-like LRR domain-containing protein n=1 Tax=Fibrivirga algicola TaxID=2950420 RepID=A0ABX0QQA4_9BACT|nr:hypothetical protein [Fibrivirga algicola]NID12958.1 hypothetical protein [Fibrivirga algicola]